MAAVARGHRLPAALRQRAGQCLRASCCEPRRAWLGGKIIVDGSLEGHRRNQTVPRAGSPGLRATGTFPACGERPTGNLIVKLPAKRVDELVASGAGIPFAPSG